MNVSVHVHQTKSEQLSKFCSTEWDRIDRKIKGTRYIQDRNYYLVATYQGKIAGCLCCHTVVGVMVLDQIIVADKFRRLGIASSLIDAVEALAKQLKCHKIYLETCPTLTNVYLIHRARGYKAVGKLLRHHGGWNFIQMVKFLPEGQWYKRPKLLAKKGARRRSSKG